MNDPEQIVSLTNQLAYQKRVVSLYRDRALRGHIDAQLLDDLRTDYDALLGHCEEILSQAGYLSLFCSECEELPRLKDSEWCREHQPTEPDYYEVKRGA